MADLDALQRFVRQLMQEPRRGQREALSASGVYAAIHSHFQDQPPFSRTTFYQWFGQGPSKVSPLLLEAIPALAGVFDVQEYEFYRVARLLPPEIDASLSLAAAAKDLRKSLAEANASLSSMGLSSAGEALVVDRILQSNLDYRITVWPIVRGISRPIHLHSWIVLQPVESLISRRRPAVENLEQLTADKRRAQIRRSVITEDLWRSLGLRWLPDPGPEWPFDGSPELCIEVPVEERNRLPLDHAWHSPRTQSILALSAPFAHGELLVALVAEALGFGTYDMRYQGFQAPTIDPRQATEFCRHKLREDTPQYAWSIAQTAEVFRRVREHVVGVGPTTQVVLLTCGPTRRSSGSRVWDLSESAMADSEQEARSVAVELNREREVVWVEYDDADYCEPGDDGEPELDFDRMIDHVRYVAAEVLNCLHVHRGGPPAPRWGPHFDDLRRPASQLAHLPELSSRVRWCAPDSLRELLRSAPI